MRWGRLVEAVCCDFIAKVIQRSRGRGQGIVEGLCPWRYQLCWCVLRKQKTKAAVAQPSPFATRFTHRFCFLNIMNKRRRIFKISWLRWRIPALCFSAVVILSGVVGWIPLQGLNYGIDFRGGSLIQVQTQQTVSTQALRKALEQEGFEQFSIQRFGGSENNEHLIQLPLESANQTLGKLQDFLKTRFQNLAVRRIETVGPRVGDELKQAAVLAVLASLLAILAYIWLRFAWRFSLAALTALFHDILFTLVFLLFTRIEVSLPITAALLTIAGYSINDTIVIFDRIRENIRRQPKLPFLDVCNLSINQTLGRTLITSGTTLFVVASLLVFGGGVIADFALTLLVGVVVGTYSSLYIASPMAWLLQIKATQGKQTAAAVARPAKPTAKPGGAAAKKPGKPRSKRRK